MKEIAEFIVDQTAGVSHLQTSIPGLHLHCFDTPTPLENYFLEPSLCIIFQGSKRVILGEIDCVYDRGNYFVTLLDLPLFAQIVKANPSRPYVGMTLQLDRKLITELVLEDQLPTPAKGGPGPALEVAALSEPMAQVVRRLIHLLSEPELIPALSPLVQKEILARLLTGEFGPRIRQVATEGSRAQQIAKVVEWIKSHPTERLSIGDLANRSGMSVSSFHQHFRALTALSPIQFQKRFRLNEARRLMLIEKLDAATAAFQVGYESPSQFSREYHRLFGFPPSRDIKNLREA